MITWLPVAYRIRNAWSTFGTPTESPYDWSSLIPIRERASHRRHCSVHEGGLPQALSRAAYWEPPIVGCGAAFGALRRGSAWGMFARGAAPPAFGSATEAFGARPYRPVPCRVVGIGSVQQGESGSRPVGLVQTGGEPVKRLILVPTAALCVALPAPAAAGKLDQR